MAAATAARSGDPEALRALQAKLAEVEEENRRLRSARGKRRAADGDDVRSHGVDEDAFYEEEWQQYTLRVEKLQYQCSRRYGSEQCDCRPRIVVLLRCRQGKWQPGLQPVCMRHQARRRSRCLQ